MTSILIVFSTSAVCSVIAVALMIRLSHKRSWYDHINERKIHTGDIPRLGGIGFALVFIIVALFICFFAGKVESPLRFLPCLAGVIITVAYGVWDDFRPLSPRNKVLIQFAAALCVLIPGYVFRRLTYFEGFGLFSDLGWLGYPITFLWLVGLPNAINLIDGVDGLAGGLSALIALSLGVVFFLYAGTPSAALFCVSLVGVMLGFLVFNAPIARAKIFMGDGGSQFLGFTLALLPLLEEQETVAALPLPYAAALLAIPIFDTTAAVWRRLRDGRRIDSPDRAHIHHKLMNLGFHARGVDAMLYGLQIVLGVLVFISIRLPGRLSLIVLGIAYAAALVFFCVAHFLNRKAVLSGGGGGGGFVL
jgi:UDP-GlcNAc:undecaprenyl-phosphate GlcNAc-1-phosphate transferase